MMYAARFDPPLRLGVEVTAVILNSQPAARLLRNCMKVRSISLHRYGRCPARPLPPVATPLDWDELDRPDLHAQRYTVHNIFQRLGQKDDPWRAIDRYGRPLSAKQIES
jgi:hypothetical protein